MFASLALLLLGLAHLVVAFTLLSVCGKWRGGPGRVSRVGSEKGLSDRGGEPSFALANGVTLRHAQPKVARRRLPFSYFMYFLLLGFGLAGFGGGHLVYAWFTKESVAWGLALEGAGLFVLSVPLMLITLYRKLYWKQAHGVVTARDSVDDGYDQLTIAFSTQQGQSVVGKAEGIGLSKNEQVTVLYSPGQPSRIAIKTQEPFTILLSLLVLALLFAVAGGSELLWTWLASNSIGVD